MKKSVEEPMAALKEAILRKVQNEHKFELERTNMGIGVLGQPTNSFVRKFRFTLESQEYASLNDFVRYVNIDYLNKTLTFSVYECYGEQPWCDELDAWIKKRRKSNESLRKNNDDILTLTTYDGCGNALYAVKFSHLTLIGDKADFDYSSNEVSVRDLSFKFEKTTRNSTR